MAQQIKKMSKLKNAARKATIYCELMEGREKIDTEDIIKYHEEGITIRDYENNIDTENGKGCCYIFDEEPSKFAFGGKVLKNMFDQLEAEYEGDIGEVKKDIAAEGLKVQLKSEKTKKGLPVTTVKVL